MLLLLAYSMDREERQDQSSTDTLSGEIIINTQQIRYEDSACMYINIASQ